MPDLEWHDFLEIGVDFIDADHQQLLEIMRGVKQAIEANDYAMCSDLLGSLLEEAQAHFDREESFLADAGYPELEEHKQYHQELFVHAQQVKRICEGTETSHRLDECFDAMARFLVDDILRGDIHFKSYLEYEGYLDR